jgi:hypothetical protein
LRPCDPIAGEPHPAKEDQQWRIGHLLTRPVGRAPNEAGRIYANFTYRAGRWTRPRRVVAKVERRPGELYPGVGYIVTNIARPADVVIDFCNKRGACEQSIKEGKRALRRFRSLS